MNNLKLGKRHNVARKWIKEAKRLISMVLVIALMISVIQVPVYAVDETTTELIHTSVYGLSGDKINEIRDNFPNLEKLEVTGQSRFYRKYQVWIPFSYITYTENNKFDGMFHYDQWRGGHEKIKYVLDHASENHKVHHIGDYAFNTCPSLIQVDFSEVETLGKEVFRNSTALPSISFPKLKEVPDSTFNGCTSLASVTLPQVTRVNIDAFKGCTSLKSITLQKVDIVGWNAFIDCTSLETVDFPGATIIYNYAFSNNRKLTSAYFPKVERFKEWAFKDCENFSVMELGAIPPTVEGNAFFNNKSERYLYVPESAVNTYKAVNDGNTNDNLWYGWRIVETLAASATAKDATTYQGNDGEIQIVAQGGVPNYQYSKDGGLNWQNESNFTGLSASANMIMVKDLYGRVSNIVPINISYPNKVKIINTSTTDVLNYGQSEGSITVTSCTGGSGDNYQYTIDETITWQDENIFSGLAAGTYKVRARDKAYTTNFSYAAIVEISQSADVTFTTSKEDIVIYGGNEGSITVTAQGGKGSYEYSMDNGDTWNESNQFSQLYPGTYDVKVRDKQEIVNISTTNSIVISQPEKVTTTVSSINVTSQGRSDGSISVNALGGNGTYEYSIDGGVTWQDSNEFNGIGAETYEVLARDKEDTGNTSELFIKSVNHPDQITAIITKTDMTSTGINDGSISIIASGGTGLYEYSIDGSASWQDSNEFNGLSEGSYKVFVRDKQDTKNISDIYIVTLNYPGQVTIEISKTNVTLAGASDGTITVTPSGEKDAYEYSIDGGVTWKELEIFTGLKPNTYEVKARHKVDISNISSVIAVTILAADYESIDLVNLIVNNSILSPAFNRHTVTYQIDCVEDLESIDITAELDNPLSSITINGEEAQSGVAETVYLNQGANLIPIVVTSPQGNNQKAYFISVNGIVNDADLSSLTLSEGTVSFDKDTTEYSVKVDNNMETIDISAIPSDSKALVLINGSVTTSSAITVEVGENPIDIMVVAQDASTKTYTVTVNRGTGDVNLSDITLSEGTLSPTFNPATTEYTATVPYTAETITISPTLMDGDATVKVNGGELSQPVSLDIGENAITIVVTGKDGVSTKTYIITITRKEALTINNETLAIGIVGGSYQAKLSAEGGTLPYTWTAKGLPTELTLNETTGKLTGTLASEGNYTVEVKVTDGSGIEVSKTLTLNVNLGCGNGAYIIQPDEDLAYTRGYTDDGIPMMTVNEGITGFKYFSVAIAPVTGHAGNEVCVFVHFRNGQQIGISATRADFDITNNAQAAFNVKAGDLIKAFIVDDLSNDSDSNPEIL